MQKKFNQVPSGIHQISVDEFWKMFFLYSKSHPEYRQPCVYKDGVLVGLCEAYLWNIHIKDNRWPDLGIMVTRENPVSKLSLTTKITNINYYRYGGEENWRQYRDQFAKNNS